jgi:multidrug efflux pump subunit AcrA (membrane-fusion protein)
LTAAVLFEGAGIVLAIVAGGAWIAMPMFRLVRYLAYGGVSDRPNRVQFAIVTSVAAGATTILLMMPEPFGVMAPGVVVYSEPHVVRAPYDGFVREILVDDGLQVAVNTEVAVMENRELEVECHELRTSARQSEMHSRICQNENDLAEMQAEDERRAAIESTAAAQELRLAKSRLVSAQDGVVIGRDIQSLVGNYAEEGSEIMTIASERRKELRVYVAQDHVEQFNRHVGREVRVLFSSPGFPPLHCPLDSVDPRAMQTLAEPALSAENGGPLAVRPRSDSDSDDVEQEFRFELLQPRFAATVVFTSEQAAALRAGQTVWVRLGLPRGTIGQVLVRSLRDWIDQRLHPTAM